MPDEPVEQKSIMDLEFQKERFLKNLQEDISNLAAAFFWVEISKEEKTMFIRTWKKLHREQNSKREDVSIEEHMDYDSLMEEASQRWIKQKDKRK